MAFGLAPTNWPAVNPSAVTTKTASTPGSTYAEFIPSVGRVMPTPRRHPLHSHVVAEDTTPSAVCTPDNPRGRFDGKTAPRELRNPRPVRSLVAARRLPPIVSLLEVTIPRLACETSPGSLRRLVWVCDGAQSAAAADRSRTLTGQPPTGAAPLDPDEWDSARGFLLGRWCRARAHVLTSAACLPPRSTKRTATLRPPAVWVKASDPGGVSGGWPTSPG